MIEQKQKLKRRYTVKLKLNWKIFLKLKLINK